MPAMWKWLIREAKENPRGAGVLLFAGGLTIVGLVTREGSAVVTGLVILALVLVIMFAPGRSYLPVIDASGGHRGQDEGVKQWWLVTGAVVLVAVTATIVVASGKEGRCVNRSEEVVEAPSAGSARAALSAYMSDNPSSLVRRQDLDDLSGSTGNEVSERFLWDEDQVFAFVTRADMGATSWSVKQVGRDCSADPINP